jgi:hypothetical protein
MRMVGRFRRSSWLQGNITLPAGTEEVTARAIGPLPRLKMAGPIMKQVLSG